MPGPSERKSASTTFEVVREYLAARATFSEEDFETVRAAFIETRLPAGDFLQRAGEVPRYAVFVARGCLRQYVIDPKGKEHIVAFAPETWWLSDAKSIMSQTPSPRTNGSSAHSPRPPKNATSNSCARIRRSRCASRRRCSRHISA